MPKPQLNTSVPIPDSYEEVPLAPTLRVPLPEKLKPVVKKKTLVAAGGLLAQNPAPGARGMGNLHSPMDAQVDDVTDSEIILSPPPEPKEGEEAPAIEPVEKCCLVELTGDELCAQLKEFGIDTTNLHKAKTVVVNALNPEPGVSMAEQLLKSKKHILEIGLGLIERVMNPSKIQLVVSRDVKAELYGCNTVQASPMYPDTMNALAMKAATGSENPKDVIVLPLQLVYDVGRVGETQLPLTVTFMTVGQKNYRTPIGTPIKALLDQAGISASEGDQMVLGGPLRGEGVYNLDVGVPKDCTALTVIPKGAYPQVQDNACTNCGECVLACPARIRPNMISRYAEFKMYDKTLQYHIEACFECGMCSFVCMANRPMLQYIRLAKHELVAQELLLSTCRQID